MSYPMSPSVNVRESDYTTYVPAVATTGCGYAGGFRWGPVDEVTLIANDNNMVSTFGTPDNDTAVHFFTVSNFLQYGNNAKVVRCINTNPNNGEMHQNAFASEGLVIKDFTTNGYLTSYNQRVRYKFGGRSANETLLIKNESVIDNYIWPSNVLFAAKYPGRLGSSLKVEVIDSSSWANTDVSVRNLFDRAPRTSVSASAVGSSNDEIHVVVYDADGLFTGTKGTVLEKFEYLSKAADGADASGASKYYKNYINDNSAYVWVSNTAPSDINGNLLNWGLNLVNSNGVAVSFNDLGSMFLRRIRGILDSNANTITILDTNAMMYVTPGMKIAVSSNGGVTFSGTDIRVLTKTDMSYENLVTNPIPLKVVITAPKRRQVHQTTTSGAVYFDFHNNIWDLNFGTGDNSNRALADDVFGIPWGTDPDDPDNWVSGWQTFKDTENIDVALLPTGDGCWFDGTDANGNTGTDKSIALIKQIAQIAEERMDSVAFISPPAKIIGGSGAVEHTSHYQAVLDIIDWRNNDLNLNTSYAVMDSCWKYQYDRYNDVFRWLPLNGDIAGLCARTDETNDPWWSPAGMTRGQIKNVTRLSYHPNRAQRDELYKVNINPITSFAGEGNILYGDKTMLTRPSAFDRINVRRLFIVLEKAISKAAKSYLFEFNDAFTRSQFKTMVEPFLRDVKARRGLYDFKVICDETNNTGERIDRNEFWADIYLKPAKSINFIMLNFVAVRTAVSFSEIGA